MSRSVLSLSVSLVAVAFGCTSSSEGGASGDEPPVCQGTACPPTIDGDSGGAAAGETCVAALACGGLSSQRCATSDPSGACASAVLRVSDGTSVACDGCDCTQALGRLSERCAPGSDGGSGGVVAEKDASTDVADGGTPDDATTGVDAEAAVTTCGASAACTAGSTYQTCTTTRSGSCEAMEYRTSDGHSFPCDSCSNCAAAVHAVSNYCTPQSVPTTTCGAATSCNNQGMTYQACTTMSGGQCTDMTYKTSDGASFDCGGCSSCSQAVADMQDHCANAGAPTTTCSTPSPCSANGVTLSLCQTQNAIGACTQAEYRTSDGQSFACTGCTCDAAAQQAADYCRHLGETPCGTTTCSATTSCCNCSGVDTCLTLTGGATCASYNCN